MKYTMLVRSLFLFFILNVCQKTDGTNFNRDRNLVKFFLFHEFQPYENIINYLKSLPRIYPENVQLLNIGYSSEGRNIPAIRISDNVFERNNNPVILIDGGMHAREWMSVAVALYLIYELVEGKQNEYLISNVDWIIIPVLNPDGYEYSIYEDATWRKTMSPTNNTHCPGVDINRNFDMFWNMFGSSKNECSDNFAGSAPFSEPESRALRNLAHKYRNKIKLYISLHSYGSMIVYPWSYTKKPLDNEAEHRKLALLVAEDIEKFRGSKFLVGPTSKLLYAVSGSSCDWMAAEIGTALIFAIELPRGSGEYFQPNNYEIVPTAGEMFEGFKTFYEHVSDKWGQQNYGDYE